MRLNGFLRSEEKRGRDGEHICGVLVQARPDKLEAAVAGLGALPGVEVHQQTAEGRLVVTVEDTPEATAGETMHRFYGVEGVISASLVYHYHDTGDTGEASS
jgi:nitrate reductase NapD